MAWRMMEYAARPGSEAAARPAGGLGHDVLISVCKKYVYIIRTLCTELWLINY